MTSYDRRGLAACAGLLFFGLASALAIQASLVDGRLPYNTTTANVIVEVIKLIGMIILWRRSRARDDNAPPFRWSLDGMMPYSVPGLMYAVQNQLVFHAVANLQPAFFQLASKMKFVSTAVLARIVLKKTLTIVQWIGILLLMLALVVSKSHVIRKCTPSQLLNTDDPSGQAGYDRILAGMFLVTATSIISGASGIANEFLLKKHDEGVSVYIKNSQLYLWGVLFNGFGCLLEMAAKGVSDPFHGFSATAWFIILLRAVEGISVSFIMLYLDNIVKCFVSAALVYTTAIVSYFMFDEPIDSIFMLGLVIASLALVLYFGPFNDVLKEHDRKKAEETARGPPQE